MQIHDVLRLCLAVTRSLAELCFLSRDEIRVVEEAEEESKVRPVNQETQSQGSTRRPASRIPNGVEGGRRQQEDASHHLSQLQTRDAHGDEFRKADSQGRECVVGVHDRVDGSIDGHEDLAEWSSGNRRDPREQQDRHVMVPVEEEDGFLASDEEDRVAQLHELGGHEEPVPESGHVIQLHLTDPVMQSVAEHEVMPQESRTSPETEDGEDSESRVPDDERLLQVKGWSTAHPSLACEQEQEVDSRRQERQVRVIFRPFDVLISRVPALKRRREGVHGCRPHFSIRVRCWYQRNGWQ